MKVWNRGLTHIVIEFYGGLKITIHNNTARLLVSKVMYILEGGGRL